MGKQKKPHAADQRGARRDNPPRLRWRQHVNKKDWVPVVVIGNVVMDLEPRPFCGFHKGERDAILTWCKQMLSEILFDCPRFIVNKETGKSAPNPDWEFLPYYEKVEKEPLPDNVVDTRPDEWIEVQPTVRPTAVQQKAQMELPHES